jgi:alpha-beta hydrolase superfamily lysophospholipase
MATQPQLSLEQIHDLRACLPDITFTPEADRPVVLTELEANYLNFYHIDFREDHFHRFGRVILPPYTIAVHYWLPDKIPAIPAKGMVILLHGYFDHMGLFEHLTRYLLAQGYGVVGFDLPGHGLSSGERASIESFDHYVTVFEALLKRVKNGFACPVSAIGQSTGGAILLKHLADNHSQNNPVVLDKVTLLAPLVEPAMWWFNKWVYLLTRNRLRGIKRKFRNNSQDKTFLEFIKKDPLQAHLLPMAWLGAMKRWVTECRKMKPCPHPVTILQGKADSTLAWRFNIKLLGKKFPNGTITLLDDVQHHMVNEAPPLREKIFSLMGF